MLAWLPSSAPPPLGQQQQPQPHAYTPTRPSPLAPRSTNVLQRPVPTNQTTMDAQKKSPRAARPNPLMQRSSADATRERRRDLFLRKVSNDRDERRYAGRSEQIMRLDYVQRQRAWEARLAKSAPTLPEPDEEDEVEEDVKPTASAHAYDEDDMMIGSSQSEQDAYGYNARLTQSAPLAEAEVEDVVAQEDEELRALLAMMEEDELPAGDEFDYGSDEDDYDSIFMEALQQEEQQQQGRQEHMSEEHDYDAMDMS
ncbi:uncharacterized protein K452DRAFT_297654 [Aplosporella prunicola CBS 121167]|uniref:Uncharacterized protein n=1 Tax=Aplosporella prunicola CBS 121167 TaxID=1176127 RepID=A0A6A6BHN0_9PEZI|nr:uncharacterized protein K452DRAFT_297654 [Aplosporella prunicola CBS 121167]KAF2142347.1 hypothetical protein K452DRAFT_297654 [Aplosporella prunicola CBS 121167]